jgi:O-antigen/teichoic acid export membrane protein
MIPSSKQIKLGAILSYFIIFFNIVIGLIYTPWMVHKIGKADYGLYALVVSFLTYFVADYGMYQAINKLVSQYRVEGKNDKIENLLGVATKIYLILDFCICLILIFVYFNIDKIFTGLTTDELIKFENAFLLAAILSVLSFPFSFIRGVFMSFEFFVQTKFFELAKKVLVISFTILLLFFNYGLYALIIAYGLIPLLISIAETMYLYKKGIRINLRIWDKTIVKCIFGISIWLFLIVLADLFLNNVSPSLLGIFSGTSEIAVFAIGNVIFGYVYTFSNALNGLFLPKVSKLYATNQNKEIHRLSIKVGRIQFIIIGYIILGIFLVGKEFIELWMGNDFQKSYYVAILLVLPNLIIYSQQIESTYLFASNKIKYRSYMLLISALSSIIISIYLCPIYGAVGAAIAICVSNTAFMLIGMNIIYYKKLGFDTKLYIKECALKFIPLYIAILVIYYIANYCFSHLFSDNISWNLLIIKGFLYSLLFFSFVYVFIMNKYEKAQLYAIIMNIKNRITRK